MFKILALSTVLTAAAFAPAAHAAPSHLWDSVLISPNHNAYVAAITTKTPVSGGSYELFVHKIVQNKPYYAQVVADRYKAQCNATGDDSCLVGNPDWIQEFVTVGTQQARGGTTQK